MGSTSSNCSILTERAIYHVRWSPTCSSVLPATPGVNGIHSHQSASLWVDYDEAIVFLLSPVGSAPNHPTVVFNRPEKP